VTFSIAHSHALCHANNAKGPVDVEVWIREGGVPLRMVAEGCKNIVEFQCQITIYAPNTLFSQYKHQLVSKTSFHGDVKNYLHNPPTSMPALRVL
jgi:hypothetical protein